ncbi:MAG: T9SS type A sorting domain-containing protein [Candidatus Cloacimonetes bacterium]|nr:T9SS type A sorting domain-containing protein [Candidatus Cloacimonadota bacterium]MDY0171270.1 T9SS type A sorting domain-containing protein [Candidatus Cloacimonadaceae bacterium]
MIPANSDQTFQIVVDDLADALRATLIWRTAGNASDRYCTLTSPSGIVFNQPDIIGGVTLKFNIPSPESGIWDAIITNNRSTTQGCSIIAEVDSDLRVAIEEIPAKHPVDHPLLLKVSVMNYVTPVSDALIYATLEKNGCQYSANLYDDGNHNDGNADDGLYANYIYAYSEPYQHGDFDLSFVIDIPSINGQRVVKQNIYLKRPQTNSYPFVTRNLHKGWNWVGYPRLKRDEFGVSKDEFGVSIEYANLSLAPYLHKILYFEDSAQYSNNHWNYYGLNSLKSPDGYKLRIDSTEDVKLYELGTIVDTLMMHPLYQGQWHWYTYPCYEKVYPQEALLNVINNIDYIMAEKWSMKKENGVWIFGGLGRPYLKYGDSIMIRATQNGALVWNNPYTTPLIVEPQKPIHFTFEDKPEYETLMIESIEGNQDFSEIGVFQDGECIGARVIQAYPIQILAYSTPPEEGGGNLSFLLYSDNKAVVTAIPSSDLYEINTDPPYSLAPEHFGFRGFSLKTDGQQLPVVLSLHSNYPNPFNPSTTISFSIPSSSNVKLTVYNIRGQVVRELSNAMMERGRHIIQWDGKDDRNSSVSSGLYFARLEHCGETKVRKMMLVK